MRIFLAFAALAAALLAPMPTAAAECCASKNSETACIPCRAGRGA